MYSLQLKMWIENRAALWKESISWSLLASALAHEEMYTV